MSGGEFLGRQSHFFLLNKSSYVRPNPANNRSHSSARERPRRPALPSQQRVRGAEEAARADMAAVRRRPLGGARRPLAAGLAAEGPGARAGRAGNRPQRGGSSGSHRSSASFKTSGFAVYSSTQGWRKPVGLGRACGLLCSCLLCWSPGMAFVRPSAFRLALRVSREKRENVTRADLMVQKLSDP